MAPTIGKAIAAHGGWRLFVIATRLEVSGGRTNGRGSLPGLSAGSANRIPSSTTSTASALTAPPPEIRRQMKPPPIAESRLAVKHAITQTVLTS
jgi:hypothetical protein